MAEERIHAALNPLTRPEIKGKKKSRQALLIPCAREEPTRRVVLRTKDAADDCGSILQTSAMRILCGEPGCEKYKLASQAMAAVMDGDGGYLMILDGHRDHVTDETGPAFFFLGADNGYPPAVPLFRDLPLNQNIGGGVRGPVLVYAARWVEDEVVGEYEQVMDWPAPGGVSDADVFEVAKTCVRKRYEDAGLL